MSATNLHIFNLAVAAAFYHPKRSVMQSLRAKLDAWVTGLGDQLNEEKARQVLDATKGTAIEPFTLSPEDVECAVFLARMAFSKTFGQTRLRIVSRDTIGKEGGLILTNNGAGYFVERYIHGNGTGLPKKSWVFFPALVPAHRPVATWAKGACLISDSDGFRIVLTMPKSAKEPGAILSHYLRHSRIEGAGSSFPQLGLRLEHVDKKLHILSGSPESMIRVMAFMANNSRVTLQGDENDPEIPCVMLGLAAPEDDPVDLPAISSSTASFACWMDLELPEMPPLDDQDKLSISSWLPPHRDWLNLIFEKTT